MQAEKLSKAKPFNKLMVEYRAVIMELETRLDNTQSCHIRYVFPYIFYCNGISLPLQFFIDALRRFFESSVVKNRVKNAIELFESKNRLEQKVEEQAEALKRQSQIIKKTSR